MIKFDTISNKELKKFDRMNCKALINNYIEIKGIIYVEDGSIYILHNNSLGDGNRPCFMLRYKYSRKIYNDCKQEKINNINYKRIEILDIENIINCEELLNKLNI